MSTSITSTMSTLPPDFPPDLARNLMIDLQILADYREAIHRARILDAKHAGDGRYVDNMRDTSKSDSYGVRMRRAVRSIRAFVSLGREIGENPVEILKVLEGMRVERLGM